MKRYFCKICNKRITKGSKLQLCKTCSMKGRVVTWGHKISKSCKGRKFSEEHRKKIGLSKKGLKLTKEHRQKISIGNKGKLLGIPKTREHKLKLSISKYNFFELHPNFMDRDRNPAWRGGISFEPYSGEFSYRLREKIRRRDNYECRICGCTQTENNRRLSVHHIDYNKHNCKENNLISLCINCHNNTNINREYWKKYFRNKVCMYVIPQQVRLLEKYIKEYKDVLQENRRLQ